MAKTYNTFTNVSVGSVLTASDYNEALENINNYRVPPMVRCVRSGNLSYTQNTAIAWNDTEFDTETATPGSGATAMHDDSTNNTRITIRTAGVYLITFSVEFTFSGTLTSASSRINKNGSGISWDDEFFSRTTLHRSAHATTAALSVNDYLECLLELGGGSSYSITADAKTHFSAMWIGQTS
jgi:hypothetical protein